MVNPKEITEEQKEAVEEIIRFIKQSGNDALASKVAERYGIIEPVIFNFEETDFYKVVKQMGLYMNVQGYNIGEDGIYYPILCINQDIRKMEELVKNIRSFG